MGKSTKCASTTSTGARGSVRTSKESGRISLNPHASVGRVFPIAEGKSVVSITGNLIGVVVKREGIHWYRIKWDTGMEELCHDDEIRYGYSLIDPSKSDGTPGSSRAPFSFRLN
jgi:hypothetical protein